MSNVKDGMSIINSKSVGKEVIRRFNEELVDEFINDMYLNFTGRRLTDEKKKQLKDVLGEYQVRRIMKILKKQEMNGNIEFESGGEPIDLNEIPVHHKWMNTVMNFVKRTETIMKVKDDDLNALEIKDNLDLALEQLDKDTYLASVVANDKDSDSHYYRKCDIPDDKDIDDLECYLVVLAAM